MPATGFLCVGIGAALGAWLRWAFGTWLNPLFPTVPLGTLSANLLGGFVIGAVMGADRLLESLRHEEPSLVYVRLPAEFGVIGLQAHKSRNAL